MTSAHRLFEHLTDFSEEQPPAPKPVGERFVPLFGSEFRSTEHDGNGDYLIASSGPEPDQFDAFAPDAESGLQALDNESGPVNSAPGDLDALAPASDDDPFGADTGGLDALVSASDDDPFGPDTGGLEALTPASDDDPFGPDKGGLDALTPVSDGDPFGSDSSGLGALPPVSGEDPFGSESRMQALEPGLDALAEPDPFGPGTATPGADPDPFAEGADPFGSESLLPEINPLDMEAGPLDADMEPNTESGGLEITDAGPDVFEADPLGSIADPLAQDDVSIEMPVGDGDVLADNPMESAEMDDSIGGLSETELTSLPPDSIIPGLEPVEVAPVDALTGPAEIPPEQDEVENQIARRFAAALAEVEETLTELVCGSVAGILAGILNDELVRKSVEALASRLQEVTRSSGALQIDVKGPVSLFEKLQDALGENMPELRHTEDGSPDLVIEIDSQIVSSRIGEWRQSVEGCFS